MLELVSRIDRQTGVVVSAHEEGLRTHDDKILEGWIDIHHELSSEWQPA